MAQRWSINEINSIPPYEFAIKFHNIVECCPNIGRQLAHKRPFQTIDNIIEEASNLIQKLDDSGTYLFTFSRAKPERGRHRRA